MRISPDPNYALLSFELHLSRKMMFSSYILTAPAVFLSFLTLVVFALPVEDVEKSQLGEFFIQGINVPLHEGIYSTMLPIGIVVWLGY